MNDTKLDLLTLHAYVDGQLDSDMTKSVLQAMDDDPVIREKVCELRRAKDLVRAGFADAEPEQQRLPGQCNMAGSRLVGGLAASLFALAIGLGGGLLGYNIAEQTNASAIQTSENPDKVVLHLGDSEPAHFVSVLNYAEKFLEENSDKGVTVEVVANAGGLDLVRSGQSSFESRVKELSNKYENLQFIACMNSIRNLRKSGVEPVLIDDVRSDTTAVDHIVKRLREGWTYRKIESLSEI